ncbi:MAG: alpha/beta hydrolase [Acidimicrobiales bacterium]
MASRTARIVRPILRSQLKPAEVGDDFVETVRNRIGGRTIPAVLGRGVGRRPVAPGELGSIDGEWIGVPAACRHVLYLHGGYYIGGRTETYATLAGRFASGLGADVLLADYRLAPEHPYPAAVDDALAAYQGLLDAGADPASTAVAGDSAGGGLSLALLLRIRSEGMPMPAAVVLFSPWTDLTCTAPSIERNDENDDMLTAAALRKAAGLYVGSADPAEPEISPLHGDLSGLPPMFVTVDDSETLLDDALRLVERATDAGTRSELVHEHGLFHVWPVLVPILPEARATVNQAVAFLDRELA